ncbi:hypothetical protein HFQ13_05400 [Acidithiobacillus sp. VAN18-1]|uniref:Uncharacterized protein n=1 Tax=Igneacidithiobacillus copahuensis TaxID=2724909 RepID=A0AAE2YPK7_9PROT|nr:hypothetical protein [Igneacidithiobacillus copahuensis]MBU2787646.1 hypothetical protein [Igneacidithiobacillus copahuensis]MBU2795982.1 hypothetical protein [Acidithiobacillus sp. VAN18-2]
MNHRRYFQKGWFTIGLVAGILAISVNTLLLKVADWIHLDIGHGGLLKFLHVSLQQYLNLSLPPASPGFKIAFHVFIGIAMALFYTGFLESAFPSRLAGWMKGLLYAAIVWLLNALVILPSLGQGIAGINTLDMTGIIYYAFAHTTFFVLLAIIVSMMKKQKESVRKA